MKDVQRRAGEQKPHSEQKDKGTRTKDNRYQIDGGKEERVRAREERSLVYIRLRAAEDRSFQGKDMLIVKESNQQQSGTISFTTICRYSVIRDGSGAKLAPRCFSQSLEAGGLGETGCERLC